MSIIIRMIGTSLFYTKQAFRFKIDNLVFLIIANPLPSL